MNVAEVSEPMTMKYSPALVSAEKSARVRDSVALLAESFE